MNLTRTHLVAGVIVALALAFVLYLILNAAGHS